MRRALVLLGLVGLVAAGCGTKTKTVTVTTTVPSTTAPQQQTTALRVYFLKNGKVQPVTRDVAKTQAVATAALAELAKGPTEVEQRDLSLTSEVHDSGSVTIENGVAHVSGSTSGLAQLVFTLTQFPTVKAVEVNGKRYTRADFEDSTPIIAVESPLPFQRVTSPLRATGTANTFEATFDYDLVDSSGKVVATHFVTATSGNGQRGTFDFTVPFPGAKPGPGKLVVYERSAANGQRIHQSEIPIDLEP
jgi:hypothetical protein